MNKREKKKLAKTAVKHWKITLALLLIVVVLFTIGYFFFFDEIKAWLGLDEENDDVVLSTAGGYTTTVDSFGDLMITFLDIGQGDCIAVRFPDGKNMLIDSGDSNSDQDVIDAYASTYNISTFHYILLTHQDSDHVSNMDYVIDNYTVNYIFRPNNYSNNSISESLPADFNPIITDSDAYISTSNAYADFMVSAYNENCTVEITNKDSDFSNTIVCGNESKTYSINFLTPTATRENVMYDNPNDYSPVLYIEYAGRKIMLTGDAEEDALAEYVSAYSSLYNVDVLKAGHHGSINATTQEFLSAVDPEYAVISCGYGNSYGHPHKAVINMFNNHDENMAIYRTDCNGDISLSISSTGVMEWDFENSDMQYNQLSGEELENATSELNTARFKRNNIIEQLIIQYVYLPSKKLYV